MNKYKWTLLLAILISLLCWISFPSNIKQKSSYDLKLSSVDLTKERSLEIPLKNNSKIHQINNETISLEYSCNNYDLVLRKVKNIKYQFIHDKALLWYLEGEDKNRILDTLSALYGFNMANQWRIRVNRVSLYHQEIEELKSYLNATDYNLIYKSQKAVNAIENKVSWLFNSQFNSEADLWSFSQDEITNYPDIELAILLEVLTLSISNHYKTSILKVLDHTVIKNHNSKYLTQDMKHILIDVLMSKNLSKQEKHIIVGEIANLGTYYFDVQKSFRISNVLNSFESLGVNTDGFMLENIQNVKFQTDVHILEKINLLQKDYPELNIPLTPQTVCPLIGSNSHIFKSLTISSKNIKKHNMEEEWHKLLNYKCAKFDFMSAHVKADALFKKFEHLHNTDIKSLSEINFEVLNREIDKLTEYDKSIFLNLLFTHEKKLTGDKYFERISLFLENGIYPKDASILLPLISSKLSTQQILNLLNKIDTEMKPNISFNTSMVMFSILLNRYELTKELLLQGKKVFEDQSDLSSIYFLLNGSFKTLGHLLEQNTEILDSIMEELNPDSEIIANLLLKIKMKDELLFNALLLRYPDIYPKEPKYTVNLTCV